MSGSVQELMRLVPTDLYDHSGRVFYSGKHAFSNKGSVYLIGKNPGGDPALQSEETISSCIKFIIDEAPDRWSAYCDESWTGRPVGKAKLQLGVQHLLSKIGLSPREVPASNLIFVRSRQSNHIDRDIERRLIDICWPFHAAVIRLLQPKAVICFGVETGQIVRRKLGAEQELGRCSERNRRRWTSYAWSTSEGLPVFGLTHPGRASWLSASADPSELVVSVLHHQDSEAM
jgi:uracil-DNA glycosylase family 4